MDAPNSNPGGMTMAAFAVAVLLGGSNFVAVRFSNTELEPFWGAGLRFGLAAILFVVLAWSLRLRWPRGRQLLLTGVYGVFTFTMSYALMYWALVRVTAGMAAVVLALVPLATPMLAAAQRLEVLNRRALVGALVALGGISWMTISPAGLTLETGGLLAILAAALTVSQSVILGKRVSTNHPVMTNAVGLVVGAPLLLGLSTMAGESWVLPRQSQAIWSVAYLVLFGSGLMFVLMLLVVRRWTASATAYAFVLFPVVTMLVEAWLANEPLTVRGVGGALLVMAGVWFGALARRPARPASPVPADAPVTG